MQKKFLKRQTTKSETNYQGACAMNKKFTKDGYTPGAKSEIVKSKKKKLKKAVIVVICIFAFLGILCAVLSIISEKLKEDNENLGNNLPQSVNLDGKSYINYYEPDYETNIFEDDDYLAKNRTVKYVISAESGKTSIILDEYDFSELDEGQRFFVDYFEKVINGDCEAYHGMFTEEYEANPKGFEKNPSDRVFPMQRIYDISVTVLARSNPEDSSFVYNGERAVFGIYEVIYTILKNDGEFRPDLADGGSIPLIFELVTTGEGTENEKTLINNVYKYSDIVG